MKLQFQKRFYTNQVEVENSPFFNDVLFNKISIDCQVDLRYEVSIESDLEGIGKISHIPTDCTAVVTHWVDANDLTVQESLRLMNLKYNLLEQDGEKLLIYRQDLTIHNIKFDIVNNEYTPQHCVLNIEQSNAIFA